MIGLGLPADSHATNLKALAGSYSRGSREVTNVIRNVFQRLGHVLETNLVDPREQYQAVLLGDPVARHAHDGGYASRGKARMPHLVGEEKPVYKLKKAS